MFPEGVTMRTSATVVTAALGIALLTAAGCSSSTKISGGSSTSFEASTTTVVDSSTTLPPADTTPVTPAPTTPPTPAPAGCPDIAPSAAAVQVNVINGDWNGDGAMDMASSWGEPSGGSAEWYIRVNVAGGVYSAVALGDLGVGFGYALGPVDVDFALGADPGVNKEEFVAIAGSNAAGYDLGVFGVGADGCVFRFDDGTATSPYVIPVHAAAATMSGMMCDGAMGSRFIARLEATNTGGADWNVRYIRVQRTDANSLSDTVPVTDTVNGASAVEPFGQAECDGTMFIGPGGDY